VDAGFVRIRGLRVRVSVQGTGEPLLLLMGLQGHKNLWAPLQLALPQFETIAFDAPGSGDSSVPWLPLSMPSLARCAVELLDALGYGAVHMLGYSFGGTLAQQIAWQSPQRVRRLVLAATNFGLGSFPPNPSVLRLLWDPRFYFSQDFLQRNAVTLFAGRLRREPHLAAQNQFKLRPIGLWWQLAALSGWCSLPWLHRLEQPTLVLAGADDPLVPVLNARVLSARIPRAKLVLIDSAGHLFPLESASEVGPIIGRFLRDPAAADDHHDPAADDHL
jgi:poly(3-hydroxyalkanoate) depolymerase